MVVLVVVAVGSVGRDSVENSGIERRGKIDCDCSEREGDS